jgi:RNA polymerase sigma-70 factor (ECF subfamily)
MHRIAVSVTLNAMRKVRRLRDRERPLDETIELRAAPQRDVDPDLRDRLHAAIGALPDSLRVPMVLYHIEGYTHGEIGTMLGIAEGTSKARVFEARSRLRGELAAYA